MEDYVNSCSFDLQTLKDQICHTYNSSVQLIGTSEAHTLANIIRCLQGLGIQTRPQPLLVVDAVKLAVGEKNNFHVFISLDDNAFCEMKETLMQTNSRLRRRVRLLGHLVVLALDRNNKGACAWNGFILYSMQLAGLSYMLTTEIDDGIDVIRDVLVESGGRYIERTKGNIEALPDRLLVLPPISPTPNVFMIWSLMNNASVVNTNYLSKVWHPDNQRWKEGKKTRLQETELAISSDPNNIANPLQSLVLCFMSPPSAALEELVQHAGAKIVNTITSSAIVVFNSTDKIVPCNRHTVKILRMHKSLCVDAKWVTTCISYHRMVALDPNWILPRPIIQNVWERDSAANVQFFVDCQHRDLVETEVKAVGGTVVDRFDDHDIVISSVIVPTLSSKMRTRFCLQEYSSSNQPHTPCERWYWHMPLVMVGVSLESKGRDYLIFLQNNNEKTFWIDVITSLGGRVIPDHTGWETESELLIVWDGFSPGFVAGVDKQRTTVSTPIQLLEELTGMAVGHPIPEDNVALLFSQLEYYSELLPIQKPFNIRLDYAVSVSSTRRLVECLRARLVCGGLRELSMHAYLGSLRTDAGGMGQHEYGFFVDVLDWSQMTIMIGRSIRGRFMELVGAIGSYLCDLGLNPVYGIRAGGCNQVEVFGTWYHGEAEHELAWKLRPPTLIASISDDKFRIYNRVIGSIAACHRAEISIEWVFIECETKTTGFCEKCNSLLDGASNDTTSLNNRLAFFRVGDTVKLLSGARVTVREPSHHSIILTHIQTTSWNVSAVFFGCSYKSSFTSKTRITADDLSRKIRTNIETLYSLALSKQTMPAPKVFCSEECDDNVDPKLERVTFKKLIYPKRVLCEGRCRLPLSSRFVVRY